MRTNVVKFVITLLIIFCCAQNINCKAQIYQKFNNWEIVEQLDEFKDPTGIVRLSYQGSGTFSNSTMAGTNPLTINIGFYKDFGIIIQFVEYGKYYASLYTGLNAPLSVKTQLGEISKFWMIPRSKGRILPCSAYNEERYKPLSDFIELLKSEVSLKCFFIDKNNQEYSFVIDCRGFTKAYETFLKYNNIIEIPTLDCSYVYDNFMD